MRMRTDLFHVGMPSKNGRVFTLECLEKMADDFNSGKATLKDGKIYRAWIEDGKLMAEFEVPGKSCDMWSKRSVSCSAVKKDE